jgi:deoxyribodipyrimidine photo-lyase
MASAPSIVWFRRDLRLRDNEALQAAIERGGAVVPVFILDSAAEGLGASGAASRWWLHGSLAALARDLAARGARLILRRGDSVEQLRSLVAETGARAVCWNRVHEPAALALDARLRDALAELGAEARIGEGQLLFDPETVRNRSGGPFKVFTPFWRYCATLARPRPLAAAVPRALRAPANSPRSDVLELWALRPSRPDWAAEFSESGEPGEAGARRRLATFVENAMDDYRTQRDRPACDGTSRLSAALHFGELTPRQVCAAVEAASAESGVMPRSRGAQVFLDEVGWREFAYHLLHHFPETPECPLRPEYATFPWQRDEALQEAWRRGRTGYPIVDAGMRQLWRTGWMHNRVRMIVASFLVKQLLQPWTDGAAWFRDTLVDADLANNTLGWQWSAGCGADAAPYFRIFNPVLQGEKFDPHGDFVRRWVPELARVPVRFIHRPWEATPEILAVAGVRLGTDYPQPIIEPKAGRERALRTFAEWTRARTERQPGGGSKPRKGRE